MSLPQANARLTRIAGGGSTEDYDRPPTGDTVRWQGESPAYFHEEVVEDTTNGRLSELKQAWLVVPRRLTLEATLGDTVTFTHDGQPQDREVTRVVSVAGSPTQRLYLRDA